MGVWRWGWACASSLLLGGCSDGLVDAYEGGDAGVGTPADSRQEEDQEGSNNSDRDNSDRNNGGANSNNNTDNINTNNSSANNSSANNSGANNSSANNSSANNSNTNNSGANNGGEPSEPGPNQGWIGGACEGPSDCGFVEQPVCLGEALGWEDGTCSQACDRFCPDRDGENSVTFCIDVEGQGGRCVARCDADLYPGTGCREGYACRIFPRFGEAGVRQGVCVPEGTPAPEAETACLRELEAAGVVWEPWGHTPEVADGTSSTCTVTEPIRAQSPIGGMTYRYVSHDEPAPMVMACALGQSLLRLGRLLREFDIVQVIHIGVYNCRAIGDSGRISQHGYAKAIDIYGFVDSQGQDYILERDWEHDTDSPRSAKARLLYDVAQRMYEERIFNIILTPNYNADHDNHFHVDLTEGSHYIGYGDTGAYMMDPPMSLGDLGH